MNTQVQWDQMGAKAKYIFDAAQKLINEWPSTEPDSDELYQYENSTENILNFSRVLKSEFTFRKGHLEGLSDGKPTEEPTNTLMGITPNTVPLDEIAKSLGLEPQDIAYIARVLSMVPDGSATWQTPTGYKVIDSYSPEKWEKIYNYWKAGVAGRTAEVPERIRADYADQR